MKKTIKNTCQYNVFVRNQQSFHGLFYITVVDFSENNIKNYS